MEWFENNNSMIFDHSVSQIAGCRMPGGPGIDNYKFCFSITCICGKSFL